ncbi:DUF6527 family protein [Chitinophaga pollutisoli]|uniref:DUF6527 family protein n=1 Tax=Chitinophaga pollutisoli TaxID=3133966 RepID=A0ABZ2YQF6_9BACT
MQFLQSTRLNWTPRTLQHRFVNAIPEQIHEDVLYIALDYGTAVHLCACGCGSEVVTPFSPKDWKVIFDGETVTLYPSIGNWRLPCTSHYFIRGNAFVPAFTVAGNLKSSASAEGNRRGKRGKKRKKKR